MVNSSVTAATLFLTGTGTMTASLGGYSGLTTVAAMAST